MGGLKWTEGIKYNPGDVVKFKGRTYKILQGHTSQGDWTPDLVPALWQAIGGEEGSEDEGKGHKKKKSERRSDNEDSEGERKSKDKKKDKKGGKYSEEESGGEGKKDKKKSKSKSKEEESEEEDDDGHKKDKKEKKSKGESEEEGEKSEKKHKKEKSKDEKSKDGGDEHKKKDKEKSKEKEKEKKGDKEEKKDKEKKSKSEEGHEHKPVAGTSGHVDIGKVPGVGQAAAKVAGAFASSQAWIEAARKTTTEFKQSGPKGPTTWVLVEDNKISPDAIRAGEDKSGNPFYVARAYYEGGLQIGRASSNGAFIGFNGREIPLTQYEVLLGDTRAIKWVPSSAGATGIRAVEGGIDHTGKQLLIAQTRHAGEIIPGKATDWINGALVALGGQEVNVKDYNILAYV